MVSTKQKPAVDIQNIKRREPKHTTMENHQFVNEYIKRGRKNKELQNNQNISNDVLKDV